MSGQDRSQLTLELRDARWRDAEFTCQVHLFARAGGLAEKPEYSLDLAIRALALKDFGVVDIASDILGWTVGPAISEHLR